MALPDTYSRRLRAASGTVDVYDYGDVPRRLRVQVAHLVRAGLGPYYNRQARINRGAHCYDYLVEFMRRELGVHELARASNSEIEFTLWLEKEPTVENWLDGVEEFFRLLERVVEKHWEEKFDEVSSQHPTSIIDEFNHRSREAGFGYQFTSSMIVRIDSQFLHHEVVLPALTLLSDKRFLASNQEYRDAHEAYKQGNLKDCLVGCGRAFESVLKTIGTERGWDIKPNDTASKLIKAGVEAGFLAPYHDGPLNSLRSLIEGSTPTIRNKEGGHGGGLKPTVVPEHLAAYQLHQTAAVILFLIEQDQMLGPTP